MIKQIRKFFSKKEEPNDKLLVWHIVEGPYYAKSGVGFILRVSQGKEVADAQFWFHSEEAANVVIKHFQSKIEPLELNIEEFERVQ